MIVQPACASKNRHRLHRESKENPIYVKTKISTVISSNVRKQTIRMEFNVKNILRYITHTHTHKDKQITMNTHTQLSYCFPIKISMIINFFYINYSSLQVSLC